MSASTLCPNHGTPKSPSGFCHACVYDPPASCDCGHACCDERTDPFHDHFLTADECPSCARSTDGG